jgi:hypothetical protein
MKRRGIPGRLERECNLLYLEKGRERSSRKLPRNNFVNHRMKREIEEKGVLPDHCPSMDNVHTLDH